MPNDVPEYAEFRRQLRAGVHAALRFLNSRTPHRFTGVYRYDGDMLRNMALFDRFEPDHQRGIDIPMANAYCANVGRTREPLEFANARLDGRFPYLEGSPVVCYSGVLISTPQGEPYGTLCHYDVRPCDPRTSDIPLLKAAAPLIYEALEGQALSA
ncbi:MAG TPA: GAF domain-containing protein [Ramlibacter sp.]|nr:GAF domain-containing protein [Ramlibacter sp.]